MYSSLIIVHFQSIAIHARFNVTQDLFKVEYGLQVIKLVTCFELIL